MYFPAINAVDEGVFVYVGLAIVSGIYGSVELWTEEYSVFGSKYRLVEILVTLCNIGMPIFIFVCFKNIYTK